MLQDVKNLKLGVPDVNCNSSKAGDRKSNVIEDN